MYLLPGLKPRSAPAPAAPNFSRPLQPDSPLVHPRRPSSQSVDEEEGVNDIIVRRRGSMRSLDSLRADAHMLQQLLASREAVLLGEVPIAPPNTRETSASGASTKSVPPARRDVNAAVIRLVQYQPEFAVLVFLNSLQPGLVVIENSPSPIVHGRLLPLLIHDSHVISGVPEILNYLNQFNRFSCLDMHSSTMASYIQANCIDVQAVYNAITRYIPVLPFWGYSWINSAILSFLRWNTQLANSNYSEELVLDCLHTSYDFISSLIHIGDVQGSDSDSKTLVVSTHEMQTSLALQSEMDDSFSVSDALLYGHTANVLFYDNKDLYRTIIRHPVLLAVFKIYSEKHFNNLVCGSFFDNAYAKHYGGLERFKKMSGGAVNAIDVSAVVSARLSLLEEDNASRLMTVRFAWDARLPPALGGLAEEHGEVDKAGPDEVVVGTGGLLWLASVTLFFVSYAACVF